MVKNYEARKFEDAVAWLRDHGFDVLEPAGTTNRVFLKKNGVSAAIEKEPKTGAAKVFASPGYLVSGEISKLIDRGYQKFLKTSKTEVPATADHLKPIHEFTEELKEASGLPSLYNESIGTVSDSYQYDRVENRDSPAADRPKRPWEKAEAAAIAKSSGKKRA